MKNYIILLLLVASILSCKQEKKVVIPISVEKLEDQKIDYATGFTIQNHKTYKEISITSPWPDAKSTFTYILHPKGSEKPTINGKASFIEVPVDKTVVTSTTDIPMLEYLGLENKLIGFPHCDYISSEKTRTLVDNGTIIELGNNGHLNTELTLELAPELIIGYSATGDIKTYDLLEKTGIPVVMNGSWMEQHPLGRAEWIKFVGAFYNKEQQADSIFKKIEKDYNDAATLANNATTTPTVLSGNMFKDVWHVPGGDSYVAKFLKDANTNYLWAETKKTGSIGLNFESVLEKAQNAQFWIGSGSSTSLEELKGKNNRYTFFEAFKNKTVYSSTLKTGAKGGLMYYELGPMRPDLILKDIIQIAHPELLTDYEPYFFEKLN
ncbi:ABC transporter substrate-binding protein [Aquimarina sp. BL5]|uniref:ABC transporter substrate-binding protein n=1 Tax=Aquimarina sp. BL5 TaxID=1714860 RepID=UPI000E4D68F5|nr:ABC transporter substrate-binding protein [Aquimarina sp. BL5]AXT53640.1 ABC transporter substrate-binding protein [Aquimarina sp. BL5]RKN05038.1 ABC transporter substrate-binding protein [Aquimarina sp. BL5]